MRLRNTCFLILAGVALAHTPAFGYVHPGVKRSSPATVQPRFRTDCDNAIAQIDQAINNVRARLTTGGDVWWNSNDGRYIVPKVPAGTPEVSSIFAGAVWLGGVDPAGNLKLAAQTYGRNGGTFDFYPGPLNPETGRTNQETCAKWDRFFVVKGESVSSTHTGYPFSQRTGGTRYAAAVRIT